MTDVPESRDAAPPAQASVRSPSLFGLTARLFARHWPALCFWFFVQYLANHFLIDAAVRLGYINKLLGFWGVALLVVTQLAITIAMFHALRRDLPSVQQIGARQDGLSGVLHAGRWSRADRLADALAITLIPFFAYYAAWGLMRDTTRQYFLAYLRGSFMGQYGAPTDALNAGGVLYSVAIAWLLRRLSLWRYGRTRAARWSIAVTLCKAYWVFVGLFVISEWKGSVTQWWHSRVAYQTVAAWWRMPFDWSLSWPDWVNAIVGPPLALLQSLVDVGFELIGIVSVPLVWLTITAIVFGRDLAGMKTFGTHARVGDLDRRYASLSPLAKRGVDRFVGGFREKSMPIVNSLRLILRAGLRPALLFCVSYVALSYLRHWGWRGTAWLIGARDFDTWNLISGPLSVVFGGAVDLAPSLLGEPLRICLLAAGLEVALASVLRQEAEAPPTVDARSF